MSEKRDYDYDEIKPIVNVLHLSDLHYSRKSQNDIDIVLKAFTSSIEKIAESESRPDIVIFSGDLVYNPDEVDVYLNFIDKVLLPTLKACGLSENRAIFVPGNHDVSRRAIERSIKKVEMLDLEIGNKNNFDALIESGLVEEVISEKFQNFLSFKRVLDDTSLQVRNLFGELYDFRDLGISVCAANNSWASWAGLQKKSDLRQLVLPECGLIELISGLTTGNRNIFVTHHPLNWMMESNEEDTRNSIAGRFGFHFYGHMHNTQPTYSARLTGSLVEQQAGALFSGRERYIGFSITQIPQNAEDSRILLYSFSDTRREFHPAEQLIAGGKFYLPNASKYFWLKEDKKINKSTLKAWITSNLLPETIKHYDQSIGGKPISDVFVEPPLHLQVKLEGSEIDQISAGPKEEAISFSDVVHDKRNLAIYGRREYGKTTLLRQIAINIMKTPNREDVNIPIIINFGDIARGDNRLARLLKSSICSDIPDVSINQILEEGMITVLIDDFDFSDKSKIVELEKFISIYPRNRYIIGATIAESSAVTAAPLLPFSVNFEAVYLKPLSRGAMRRLVAKWGPAFRLDQDNILDKIIRETTRINVPLTAANGTILLVLFESQVNFAAINRAVLIENFIETLLGKTAADQAERRAFDFVNQKHLLSFIAGWMAENDQYIVDRLNLIKMIEDYLDKFGLVQNAEKLLHEFIRARIFEERSESRIAFYYKAFLEYFISIQMASDVKFRSWIMEDERYLSFVNEIIYYAGIVRDDEMLIQDVSERFLTLIDTAFSLSSWSPNVRGLKDLVPPIQDTFSHDLAEQFERHLGLPPLTQEERDQVLDTELPSDSQRRQEVFRPKLDSLDHKLFLGLILYSGLVQNLELISDGEKRRHLNLVLGGWAKFLVASLSIVPQLVHHRKLFINGVKYEVVVPKNLSDGEVARIIYAAMPTSIVKNMTITLGTEKLERQLREPRLEENNEPEIISFFRAAMLADLKLSGWVGAMRQFLEKNRKSTYMIHILLWKIRELHFMDSVPRTILPEFKNLLVDGLTQLRGGSKPEQTSFRNKKAADFDRLSAARALRARHAKAIESD